MCTYTHAHTYILSQGDAKEGNLNTVGLPFLSSVPGDPTEDGRFSKRNHICTEHVRSILSLSSEQHDMTIWYNSIYSTLGVTSYPKTRQSIWQNIHGLYTNTILFYKEEFEPDVYMVAHICNLSPQEAEAGGSLTV